MTISRPIEPIRPDEAALAKALADAHLPSLLAALAYLTGDLSLLRPELRPDTFFLAGEQGGYTPEQQAEARALCLGALLRLQGEPAPAAKAGAAGAGAAGRLGRVLEFVIGPEALEAYLPVLEEELSIAGRDLRAPGWRKEALAPARDFRVAIVGAGMSGLLAAVRLDQAGVPYVIFEKNEEVGGTWWENTYPGCRVDVANHFYSYSFAQKEDWPQRFSPQRVLLDYFRECADAFGVRPKIRFRHEVRAASFDEARAHWTLRVATPAGEESFEADAVISAVGQLNQPKLPDIPGRERFRGPAFHSARWDHAAPLAGRRVAVIGTGASAAQFVPVIADEAAELRVFQRTPNWMFPVAEYHADVPAGLAWLFRHVPHYAHFYRFWLFWTTGDGSLLPRVVVDPSWPHPERAVSAGNDELRALATAAFEMQLADRTDLIPKVVPRYPPAAKRILFDNGAWLATLKRPHVHLHTEPIREVTERGIVTGDGALHEADVIVYATGFQASRFLTPMRITGRSGLDLHAHWDGNARAYLGVTVPGFPNFFLLYGPNTNIVVNGSIIYFSECEVRYVLGCLRLLLAGGHRTLEVKREVHDAYNRRVDEGNARMAWGAPSTAKVSSWYKSPSGRVAQNWPFTLLEYWRETREPRASDYALG